MPIRNEARYISRALRSVLLQQYPPDRLEVIVADGMSEDGTREIVRRFQAFHPQLKMIDNPTGIVPTALNAGLRLARGSVIVRIDGHCEIDRDYIARCVEHLENGDVVGVGGPIVTVGESHLAKAIALAMSSPFGVGGSTFRTVQNRAMQVDTIPFPAYSRRAIQKAGLYDEELVRNQDDEYNYRLAKLGGILLLSPDIRSRYYSRASLRSLWRQYFQYGFWKVRVMQKHPLQLRLRHFVPFGLVLALLTSAVGAVWNPIGRAVFCLTVGAYLGGLIIGALWTARKSRWNHLILLPVAFATLHLSYGLGFLKGLIVFANRWTDRTGKVPDFSVGTPHARVPDRRSWLLPDRSDLMQSDNQP